MKSVKEKISVSIESSLAKILDESAQSSGTSKSALVEEALHQWVENRLAEDARATAKATFDDLPNEDEWTKVQPKW